MKQSLISCLDREFPERAISLDLAADNGVVNKSGAWYAYNGDKIGQGRENAKQYLKENPLICEEMKQKSEKC